MRSLPTALCRRASTPSLLARHGLNHGVASRSPTNKRCSSSLTLHYETIGEGKSRSSTRGPVLFLHGLLGNGRNLNTFAKKVCQQQSSTGYLMDLRGHGKSRISAASNSSFDACAQDIRHTLQESRTTHPTTLVGHSWGGRLALQYAASSEIKNNDNLQRVWLLDTVPGQANESVERVISVVADLISSGEQWDRKSLIEELQARGLDPATSQWLASSYKIIKDKDGGVDFGFDLDVIQDILPEFGTQDFFGLLEAALQNKTIRVDLVRGGKNSGWTLQALKDLQAFANEYPTQFHLHVLPKAGHWVHVDDLNGLVDLFKK